MKLAFPTPKTKRPTFPKLTREDILFYIAYGIFMVFGILSKSFYYQYFASIYTLIKYFCIAILFFRELLIYKYSFKSLFIGAVFVVLILLTRSQSSIATITYILIFVFCARNVEFKGIVRFSAWISLMVILFVIASSYLGIIEDYVYYDSTRVRHYLGFLYSLYAPAFLFNITGLFIYLKKDKISWLTLLALLVFNCWMFAMTVSRLSFGLSVLLIVISGFMKLFPNFLEHKHRLCLIMVFSFVICFSVSMFFAATYDSSVSWQNQLNSILENRLSLGHSALYEYGITLFGQEIEFIGNGLNRYGEENTTDTYNFVDSYYEQTLLRYGVVFMTILLSLLTYTLYYFYKKGDYWLLLWLTIVAIRCLIESTIDLYYCTYWFAISVALFKQREIKED